VRFDDQGHGLNSEVLGHRFEAANLTPKSSHGEQQTHYGQDTGAGSNEYSDLTSRHD
jgi:hypothetical protein